MSDPSTPPRKGGARDGLDVQRGYARYASLGLQFAATLALFMWLGWWVDEKLHTSPVFLLVGVLLGFVGSLVSIVSKVPPPRARRVENSKRPNPKSDDPRPPRE
jgi:F0F1-type ATP synthase assembly protein I